MMRWHRLCAIIAALLVAYVVTTGFGVQFADMRALVTHAPDSDHDMRLLRQHINGTANFIVISWPDYAAPALPAGLDYPAAIARAAALGRAARPGATLRLVEVRSAAGRLAAHVRMDDQELMFDLQTGAALPASLLPPPDPGRGFTSLRGSFKYLHRFSYINQAGTALDGLAGIALMIMVVTGFVHYARLYRMRAKIGKKAPLWQVGNGWRGLHRSVAIVAAIPVLWISISGLLLSIDNVAAWFSPPPPRSAPDPFSGDVSAPLRDGELAGMTERTLAAFHQHMPDTALKVLRLRYFAGYPQGVVVAADSNNSQLVYNATSGAPMGMTEKGYPRVSFPSGWEWHQRLKQIHRGDIFGMPGRWLDTIGGLSLLYLILSGVVMYFQLWSRRRRAGRGALVWK
jgi:uncharacterized iron-regulated membrane protein